MTDGMYSAALPASVPSPRIVGGVLKWYAGDTFELQVDLQLTDEDGRTLPLEEGHTVEFLFRDCTRAVVYAVCFQEITDNRVVLWFNDEVSARFPKGSYTYDVIYKGAVRRTLVHNGPITVE